MNLRLKAEKCRAAGGDSWWRVGKKKREKERERKEANTLARENQRDRLTWKIVKGKRLSLARYIKATLLQLPELFPLSLPSGPRLVLRRAKPKLEEKAREREREGSRVKRKGRTWRGKARKKERKEDATRSERKTLFSPLLFRGDGLSPSIQISPMYPRSRISREKNLSRGSSS